MEPMTMPAMAPPERPELEVDPLPELTTTVVVGWAWRGRRRVRGDGRVRVGAMVAGGSLCLKEARLVDIVWFIRLEDSSLR